MAPPPIPPRIGFHVRDLMVQLLADKAGGWNATIAAWAAAYGVQPFKLDFSESSPNVFLGQVEFDDLQRVAPVQIIPMGMVIASGRKDSSDRRNRTKFCLFSGMVYGQVKLNLAWPQSLPKHDFQPFGELGGDALISIFNREQNQGVWNPYVAYDGDIVVDASTIAAAEEHWRQNIIATLKFGVRVEA